MGERLKGKVAIVTGGAAGIGQATAMMFAGEGASVVIADLDEAAGLETVEQILKRSGKAIFVRADVSSESDAEAVCRRAVEHFGGLQILVDNAALVKGLEATPEDWRLSLGVNVVGTALMSRYANKPDAPHRRRRGASSTSDRYRVSSPSRSLSPTEQPRRLIRR